MFFLKKNTQKTNLNFSILCIGIWTNDYWELEAGYSAMTRIAVNLRKHNTKAGKPVLSPTRKVLRIHILFSHLLTHDELRQMPTRYL